MPMAWWVTAATACVSLTLTWAVRTVARRRNVFDTPNERSAHSRPTPRLGGIGIVVAFIGASIYHLVARTEGWRSWVFIFAAALIAVVGLVDDLRSLSARVRFGLQTIAAALVVGAAWPYLSSRWSIVLGLSAPQVVLAAVSVLWIVWLTNLYNFMDGIDGLAGGQAVVASIGIAAAAAQTGGGLTVSTTTALAAAALGFLFFNFPPASIFMGDVGSTTIGFFLASVPFFPEAGAVPVDVVGLALALFILDATVTLVRRLVRGEHFFRPHRTHFYQRPLALGLRHRTITLWSYAGMALMSAFAAASVNYGLSARWWLIGGAIAIFCAYASVVVMLERSRKLDANIHAQRAGPRS